MYMVREVERIDEEWFRQVLDGSDFRFSGGSVPCGSFVVEVSWLKVPGGRFAGIPFASRRLGGPRRDTRSYLGTTCPAPAASAGHPVPYLGQPRPVLEAERPVLGTPHRTASTRHDVHNTIAHGADHE